MTQPHDDGERLGAPKDTEPKPLPTKLLVRAARIRNGLRVDLTADEWAERAALVAEWQAEATTPERRREIERRIMEIDHGHAPAPVPSWVRSQASARRATKPQVGRK